MADVTTGERPALFQFLRLSACRLFGHKINAHNPWGPWCSRCKATVDD